MEFQEIQALLTQFDQSSLTEFDLKDGTFGLYFNKNQECRPLMTGTSELGTVTPATPQPTNTTPAKAEVKSLANESLPQVTPVIEAEGSEIVSPVVGVVYLKPAPDKPDFKKVGDRVEKGEVVCIVEAMKVMNEITADVAGEITAVLVENEQVVEYNQGLFKVKEG